MPLIHICSCGHDVKYHLDRRYRCEIENCDCENYDPIFPEKPEVGPSGSD